MVVVRMVMVRMVVVKMVLVRMGVEVGVEVCMV